MNFFDRELRYNRFYEDSNGNDIDGTCPCGMSAAATATATDGSNSH